MRKILSIPLALLASAALLAPTPATAEGVSSDTHPSFLCATPFAPLVELLGDRCRSDAPSPIGPPLPQAAARTSPQSRPERQTDERPEAPSDERPGTFRG